MEINKEKLNQPDGQWTRGSVLLSILVQTVFPPLDADPSFADERKILLQCQGMDCPEE